MGSETTRDPARLRRPLAYLWRRLQATEAMGEPIVRLILRLQASWPAAGGPAPG